MDRALPSEGRGQRFESSRVRQFSPVYQLDKQSVLPNLLNKAACHASVTAKGDGLWLLYERGETNGKRRSEEAA